MNNFIQTICDIVRFGVTKFEEAGLFYGHGTDNAFDEAAFLVLESLHLPPERLEEFWQARLREEEIRTIFALYEDRIGTRKPASYLVNKAYIQGYPFYVDERVIVPRSFIAEILCGEHSPVAEPDAVGRVLDLCTGSGCLAVLAAQLFSEAEIDATDLSSGALAVAGKNVATYGLEDRIWLYEGDLFAPLPEGAQYDLIIANPPYVDAEGMEHLPPEFRAEPEMALEAGEDGLAVIDRILAEAADYLSEDGILVCEVGRCGPALQEAYPDLPFGWLETENSNGEVFFLTRDELLGGASDEESEEEEDTDEEEEDEDEEDEEEDDEGEGDDEDDEEYEEDEDSDDEDDEDGDEDEESEDDDGDDDEDEEDDEEYEEDDEEDDD